MKSAKILPLILFTCLPAWAAPPEAPKPPPKGTASADALWNFRVVRGQKGQQPPLDGKGSGGRQFHEISVKAFLEEKSERSPNCEAAGSQTSPPGLVALSMDGTLNTRYGDSSNCASAEEWLFANTARVPAGKAVVWAFVDDLDLSAQAGRNSKARVVAGIKIAATGGKDIVCEFDAHTSGAGRDPSGVQFDPGSKQPIRCDLGKIPGGSLRIGPWVGMATSAPEDDPALKTRALLAVSKLLVQVEREPEPKKVEPPRPAVVNDGKIPQPGEIKPFQDPVQVPGPVISSPPPPPLCPTPIIVTPRENQPFDKGPVVLTLGALAAAPDGMATVRIERVGGSVMSVFDMPLNTSAHIGYILAEKWDGSFPVSTQGTYRITVSIAGVEAPADCLSRIFQTTARKK